MLSNYLEIQAKKILSQIFFSVLKNWMIVSILCIIEGKAENDAWVLFQKEREKVMPRFLQNASF